MVDETRLLSCRLKKAYGKYVFGICIALAYISFSIVGCVFAITVSGISLIEGNIGFIVMLAAVFDAIVICLGMTLLYNADAEPLIYYGIPIVVAGMVLLIVKLFALFIRFVEPIWIVICCAASVIITAGYIFLWCYCEMEKCYVRLGKITV
jgi:hypothetical protein